MLITHKSLSCCSDTERGFARTLSQQCLRVLPQVDGANVSLNASGSTQHLATILPQALEHHLHGVLQETHSTSGFH